MIKNEVNQGFSLIALAITIIFVGIIVSGIIFARYLMNSSESIELIEQITKYEASTMAFKKTFGKYPGNSANFTPAGDEENMLNDQLGMCSRAPNDNLSNQEKYQFWGQLSQSALLKDEKYESYSPPSCGGTHSETWSAAENAGILWPYIQLDEKAAKVFNAEDSNNLGDKSPFWVNSDNGRKQIYFTFYMNAKHASPFKNKFEKMENAANAVELINVYGDNNCKSTGVDKDGNKIDEIVNCKDKNAALAKFIYYVKTDEL
jgi:hypothetical protein